MFCLMLARVYCKEGLGVPIYGREAPHIVPACGLDWLWRSRGRPCCGQNERRGRLAQRPEKALSAINIQRGVLIQNVVHIVGGDHVFAVKGRRDSRGNTRGNKRRGGKEQGRGRRNTSTLIITACRNIRMIFVLAGTIGRKKMVCRTRPCGCREEAEDDLHVKKAPAAYAQA